MSDLSSFIRNAPKFFYVAAAVDFLKNVLPYMQLFTDGRFRGEDYTVGIGFQLFAGLLNAVVFALGWIAYGMVAALLIAIYDQLVAIRAAAAEDLSNA